MRNLQRMIGNVWSNVSGFSVGGPTSSLSVGDGGIGILGSEKWELFFDYHGEFPREVSDDWLPNGKFPSGAVARLRSGSPVECTAKVFLRSRNIVGIKC